MNVNNNSNINQINIISTISNNNNSTVSSNDSPFFAIYNKLIKNLENQQSNFNTLLNRLPKKELIIDQLCQHLEQSQLVEIEKIEHYLHYALLALKENKLSLAQFCTLDFYWSFRNDYPHQEIKSCPLFDQAGEVNPEAKDLIRQTLQATKEGINPSINKHKLDCFFDEMKKLPLSEQQFFFTSHPTEKSDYLTEVELGFALFKKERTIVQQIEFSADVNTFLHANQGKDRIRIMPSFSMMQTFLRVKSQEDAVTITPTIGVSTIEEIKDNGLTDTRDMGLPFPAADFLLSDQQKATFKELCLPQEADQVTAPKRGDFIYHDFYHAQLASNIPSEHRKASIKIASLIEDLLNSENYTDELRKCLMATYERFIDLENPFYRPEMNLSFEYTDLSSLFWYSKSSDASEALNLLALQNCQGLPLYQGLLKHSYFLNIANSNVYRQLANRIILHKKDFKAYDVSFKSVHSIAQDILYNLNLQLDQLPNDETVRREAYKSSFQANFILQLDIAHQEYKKQKQALTSVAQ